MNVLAIETATKQLGVAVCRDETVSASYEVQGVDYPHAAELADAVMRVLRDARTTLAQIDAIAVDVGPGSFTGLRIGLAFVKALVFARRITVLGVPSLDVLAAGASFSAQRVCPLLDAKQQNVYAALYHVKAGQIVKDTDYLLGPVDQILAQIDGPMLFLGDGVGRYRDHVIARCGEDAHIAPQEFWTPRVATLARLGHERLAQGLHDDPSRLVPKYLYPFDCSVRGADRPTSVLPTPVVHAA